MQSTALNETPAHSYEMSLCHDTGSRSVTYHPTQVITPALQATLEDIGSKWSYILKCCKPNNDDDDDDDIKYIESELLHLAQLVNMI